MIPSQSEVPTGNTSHYLLSGLEHRTFKDVNSGKKWKNNNKQTVKNTAGNHAAVKLICCHFYVTKVKTIIELNNKSNSRRS